MKFDVAFEREYPHPVEKVWNALTDATLLGQWLMETDFEPVVGRLFNMWCDDGKGGKDRYLCKVLSMTPPGQMCWSWVVDGNQHLGATEVAFELEKTATGTKLTIRHSGDGAPEIIEAFKSGWPSKLDTLQELLS